jgi:hypothetical protein
MLNASRATPIQQQKQFTINEEEASSPSIASKSMLGILLTQPTTGGPSVLQNTPSSIRTSTPTPINEDIANSPSIASKSMLGILLTQPTEAEPSVLQKTLTTSTRSSSIRISTRATTNEELVKSPSIASKSMLGILLTQPTEAEPSVLQKTLTTSTRSSSVRMSTQATTNEEALNSPSIASKSMLEILLTKPTAAEPSVLRKKLTTSIIPSPVRTSRRTARKSDRLSSHPTPRVSINPLHSSTPSSTRHKSLQMVSIGEQEQVLTTVPPQINIEIQEEEEQQIEILPLNDTEQSIQQPSAARTIEIGIQTTPSLDVSSRRRLKTLEQQATPIPIINEQQRQITPLQAKIIMNLQRNVRFQLTPSTDARLVAKEQVEETLRGLKPDIVITPAPVKPQTKQETAKPVKTAPIKKATKPKKKVIASKKKKVVATKKTEPVRCRLFLSSNN